MGVKERQEREREEVRRKILDAARELFVAEGYRNVSIRKVAEKVEYSPAALYGYFSSKDDLFFALAEEGFHKLFDYTNQAVRGEAPAADPLEAVREGFLRYYRFSRKHPEYFELMFVDRTVPRIGRDWERFAFVAEMIGEACGLLQRAIDAGVFPAGLSAEVAFHILWAAAHGPATAALCERLAPEEDPDALARDTLEAAIAGLRAGIPITFTPAECAEPTVLVATKRGNEHES
ncbi:MAG TPA: TetR/AcrR family transcriptional regulator [Vicinamibacterales bacterium]|nr:TetR/AcrR family transcriptional regulator [Vicinamibacterales bacterium]